MLEQVRKGVCKISNATGTLVIWSLILNVAFAEDAVPVQVGAASTIINNRLGGWVQGAGVPRQATEQRDDLEANALYLSDGKTKLLLVSCDLVSLNSAHVAAMRDAMGEATGIPSRNILIACTHTHGGPSLVKTNYLMPIDLAYIERLQMSLVELAQETVQQARPGKIGWGKGEAEIGFNRRLCWADGTHSMYGDASRDDFAGLEGPNDPQHLAIFVAETDGELIAVLHHNTTHVATYYGAGIYTAEFPGEARKILRKQLGEIPILFFSGAQGDIAIPNNLNRQQESRDQQVERIGRLVADETLRLYQTVTYDDHPALGHAYDDLKVQVRLPDPDRLVEAHKVLARIDAGENIRGMKMIMAFGAVQLQDVYGETPIDTLPIHVIRIGDVALVTQPCELYCQFGLDIKRRSSAPITAVIGLADGYAGYCPTIYGILGGGYSGQPIFWTRLEANAGYMIVESAGRMLSRVWNEQKVER